MSQHSDDASSTSGSDSFWEPGNYKRTVRRVEDGFKLCNDMMTLIQERSEIEKGYGKSLKTWSKKWGELIEKGPEYGTTEAGWRSMCEEADRRCDLHVSLKDRLLNEIISSIKQWQKDSYHKSMMYLKEKKECEDNFKKVSSLSDVCLPVAALFPSSPALLPPDRRFLLMHCSLTSGVLSLLSLLFDLV